MSYRDVLWQLFTTTGYIGHYLLYKYLEDKPPNHEQTNEGERDLCEVASERG